MSVYAYVDPSGALNYSESAKDPSEAIKQFEDAGFQNVRILKIDEPTIESYKETLAKYTTGKLQRSGEKARVGAAKSAGVVSDSDIISPETKQSLAPYSTAYAAANPKDTERIIPSMGQVIAGAQDVFSLPGRAISSIPGKDWDVGRTHEDEGTSTVGSIIRDPVTGALTLAPWAKIGSAALSTGAGLARYLPSVVTNSPRLFKGIGGILGMGSASALTGEAIGSPDESALANFIGGLLGGAVGTAINESTRAFIISSISKRFKISPQEAAAAFDRYGGMTPSATAENAQKEYDAVKGVVRGAVEDVSSAPSDDVSYIRHVLSGGLRGARKEILKSVNSFIENQHYNPIQLTKAMAGVEHLDGKLRQLEDLYDGGIPSEVLQKVVASLDNQDYIPGLSKAIASYESSALRSAGLGTHAGMNDLVEGIPPAMLDNAYLAGEPLEQGVLGVLPSVHATEKYSAGVANWLTGGNRGTSNPVGRAIARTGTAAADDALYGDTRRKNLDRYAPSVDYGR